MVFNATYNNISDISWMSVLKRRAIILQICPLNFYLLCFRPFFAIIYKVFWSWIRTKNMVFNITFNNNSVISWR